MAESKKQTIVMMCSVIGCIVTLITCGVLIGSVQAKVEGHDETIKSIVKAQNTTEHDISLMKEESAFLKGVVTTQLTSIQSEVTEIKLQVNELTRVD